MRALTLPAAIALALATQTPAFAESVEARLARLEAQNQAREAALKRQEATIAEQQARIERLEQEVRRLHEAHGVGHADGEKRDRKREEKGAKRRDEEKQGAVPGGNETPNVSYEGEESESL